MLYHLSHFLQLYHLKSGFERASVPTTQGPDEDITSVINNWEASYESHYPFNAMCTLSILSIVVTYSTVKLNGRYSIRFSIGETRHSLTKPKDKLLPKSKQIAKCNLMSPTCNSFNH
jgi:hypothetical protein